MSQQQELIREIVSDVSGKVFIDFLKHKELKLDQKALIDILLADAVFVLVMKDMIRKQKNAIGMEMMDLVGKFVSRVVVKMLQGKKVNYLDLAIDVAVGEGASLVAEQFIPAM